MDAHWHLLHTSSNCPKGKIVKHDKLKLKRHRLNHYRWCDAEIDMPLNHDVDVRFKMPDGNYVLLQFRVDGNSVDVFFPEPVEVALFKDEEFHPAPKIRKQHFRMAKQLVVCLPEPKEK